MVLDSKRGAISLGLTVLILIVIALVVLIVLSNALRTYIVGGFDYFAKLISGASGSTSGIGGTATTNFIAYSCLTSKCAPFTSTNGGYTWAIDYNGQNLSGSATTTLTFSDIPGNYSYTAYDVDENGSGFLCSNVSSGHGPTRINGSAYAETSETKIIYYFSCT